MAGISRSNHKTLPVTAPLYKRLALSAPPFLSAHKQTLLPSAARRTPARGGGREGEGVAAPGKMKTILASETMDIPEGVTVTVAAKLVTVEGPRGKLTRNFKHLNLDFQLQEGGRKLKVDAWFGTRRTMAAIRTAISHVQNLIKGVTKGYRYKMRFVYAHFPINASITNSNTAIEIRNFLGEKKVPIFLSRVRRNRSNLGVW